MRLVATCLMGFIALVGTMTIMPLAAQAEGTHAGKHHMNVTGTVTEVKSGILTVKTPVGVLTLNQNVEQRHGHDAFKVGDQVSIWVNENNTVIDVHQKGKDGVHRFVTGKLVYVGKMKKEIKLWTPEGDKVFPLDRLEVKTGGVEEGALVTVELNETGTVIDLHRAESSH